MSDWEQIVNLAIKRVKQVAQGGTINGAYKMLPEEALVAFRADLLILVSYTEASSK